MALSFSCWAVGPERKGVGSCWQGRDGYLGLLVTPPEVDPSGPNLGLNHVPDPLPGADRWSRTLPPATPQDSLTIGQSWCQQYPPSTDHPLGRLAWSSVGGGGGEVGHGSGGQGGRGQSLWGKGTGGYSEPAMWGRVQIESLPDNPGAPWRAPHSLIHLCGSCTGQSGLDFGLLKLSRGTVTGHWVTGVKLVTWRWYGWNGLMVSSRPTWRRDLCLPPCSS